MSFEHPNRNNESMRDVELDIMSRPPEHNTTNLDLDRMNLMLDILGHPEQSFRVIHITGTNGKGSTARMAEAICRAYGMRTGLYTSPHLEKINERIAIDGQQLSDDDFIDIWDQTKDLVALVDAKMEEQGKPKMSFFEVLTAMAIWKFADTPVDVAIVEVGMGGLWDATNVLNADAAIIGPVDMDHMQWLGDTVEQIATEKAGIIKPNCTAIIGPQPHEEAVMPILAEAAERNHAMLVRDGYEMTASDRMAAVGGQVATLTTPNGTYEGVPIAKFGEHQAHNALGRARRLRSGDSGQRSAGRRLGGRGVELGQDSRTHRTDPHLTDHHSGWRTQRECRRSPAQGHRGKLRLQAAGRCGRHDARQAGRGISGCSGADPELRGGHREFVARARDAGRRA